MLAIRSIAVDDDKNGQTGYIPNLAPEVLPIMCGIVVSCVDCDDRPRSNTSSGSYLCAGNGDQMHGKYPGVSYLVLVIQSAATAGWRLAAGLGAVFMYSNNGDQ